MPVPRPSYPMLSQTVLYSMARANGVAETTALSLSRLLARILDKQAIDERLNYFYLDAELLKKIPFSLIDAKGDLIAGTGPDSAARLPVGPPGTQLVADPASPTGLSWATANPPSCRVYRTSSFLIAHNTDIGMQWTNAFAPPGSGWETMFTQSGSNQWIKLPIDGEYLVYGSVFWTPNGPAPGFADAFTGMRIAHINVIRPGQDPETILDHHVVANGTFESARVNNNPSRTWWMPANTLVEMTVLHLQEIPSPPDISVAAYPEHSPHMGVTWLRS